LRPTEASVNELLTLSEERRVVLMDESGAQAWTDAVTSNGSGDGSQ
jgi:hypothetical protein